MYTDSGFQILVNAEHGVPKMMCRTSVNFPASVGERWPIRDGCGKIVEWWRVMSARKFFPDRQKKEDFEPFQLLGISIQTIVPVETS